MKMNWRWGYQRVRTAEQSPSTLVEASAPVSQIFALGQIDVAINIEVGKMSPRDGKQCSMVRILL